LTQSPGVQIVKHGNVTFICPHSVMVQVAQDLSRGIGESDFSDCRAPILVYVGLHWNFGRHWLKRGYKIGIQTEHLYDECGSPMWGRRFFDLDINIDQAFMFLDGVLDLSIGNRAYYDGRKLPRSDRILSLFGPFVFPQERVNFSPGSTGSSPSAAFYGSLGAKGTRRRNLIEAYNRVRIDIPKGAVFGSDLSDFIAPCDAVMNIHFEDGLYAEAPRLLSAYLHGKPVISEPLGMFFEANRHYMTLDDVDVKKFESVFEEFSLLVTSRYSFYDALRKLGA
jgi:hypothetical protein